MNRLSDLLHLNHGYYHFALWNCFDGKDEESQIYYLENQVEFSGGKKNDSMKTGLQVLFLETNRND